MSASSAAAEFSPLKNSVRPTFRNRTRHFNKALLRGLDHALAEMGTARHAPPSST